MSDQPAQPTTAISRAEAVQYAVGRVLEIASAKLNAVVAGAPTGSVADAAIQALRNAGRRPRLLPRHRMAAAIEEAIVAGETCVAVHRLVLVPGAVTRAHREWEDAADARQNAHAQIGDKRQSLIDGLYLGTVEPSDAIAQMNAFIVTAAPVKERRPKVEKPAKPAKGEDPDAAPAEEPVAEEPVAKPAKVEKPAKASKPAKSEAVSAKADKPAKGGNALLG